MSFTETYFQYTIPLLTIPKSNAHTLLQKHIFLFFLFSSKFFHTIEKIFHT